MALVGAMNNIRNRAEEIVNAENIYTLMAKGPTEMVGPCLYGVLSCNTAPERSSVGFIRKYFVTSKLFKQSMATRFVCLPVLT